MTPDAVQHQNQQSVIDFIDQQPVRLDVTFPAVLVVTGQIVVAVFWCKGFPVCENIDDLKKLLNILFPAFAQASDPF